MKGVHLEIWFLFWKRKKNNMIAWRTVQIQKSELFFGSIVKLLQICKSLAYNILGTNNREQNQPQGAYYGNCKTSRQKDRGQEGC